MFQILILNACIGLKLINLSGEEWNAGADKAAIKRAEYTCKVRYHGCLSQFIKKEPLNYYAICKRD